MLLEQLLETGDFAKAVASLATGFRKEHDLGSIDQLGLVVQSVEEAAEKLEKLGIGPFFISSGSPVQWHERGKPGSFTGKLGLARYKGVDLELLEPGRGSDFYSKHLDQSGGIVVQHLGFFTKNVDEKMALMNRSGIPTYVRGKIKTGPFAFEFAYMDTSKDVGFIIELIGFTAFGINLKPPGFAYHLLGALEKASGFRCIDVG